MAKPKTPLSTRIRAYQETHPNASAKDIAAKFKTTAGYIYAIRNSDKNKDWKTVSVSTSDKPLSHTITMMEDDLTKLTDEQLERMAHNLGKPRIRMQASTPEKTALDVQVGGGHYKNYAIQPVEFITKNNIGFLEGSIIKRVVRWRDKNGIEDLNKIKHEVDLLIQLNGLK
jgi:hypothetical protein